MAHIKKIEAGMLNTRKLIKGSIGSPAFYIWLLVLALPISMNAQQVDFNALPLDFIYDTQQYPSTIADVDGDGREELVRFNNGGVFIDFFPLSGGRYTRHLPLNIQHPPKWSVCGGDVDNNGLIDFVFGSDQKAVVLQQNARGYIEYPLTGNLVSQRSNLVDGDGDGDLDLFVCNDEGENFYYENDGTGHFTKSTALSDLTVLAGNYSSIWTDVNGDRLLDLYISKCFGNVPPSDDRRKNLLYINKGNDHFEELGQQSGVDDTAQSWTSAVEDFDNDGDMDLYVLNHDQACRLYRNNGDGSFTDVIATSGLNALDYTAFEVVTGDFNNDGFCDVLTDQQQALFLGNGDLTFAAAPGPAKAGAVGDLNNDGFLDVFKGRTLFENTKNNNHWIRFWLNGIQSNKQGIGASIRVYKAGNTQTRELRSGQGYAAMSSLNIHFGLGSETKIDSAKVFWPSGITTTVSNLLADASYEITECEGLSAASNPEVRDSLICQSSLTLSAPNLPGKWLWSNGDTTAMTTINTAGNYTAYHQEIGSCWKALIRYRIQLENHNPPVFLRDSILTTQCFGSEVRLPYYTESDILSSQNWDGKKYLYADQEGRYTIEKSLSCVPGQILADSIYISFLKPNKPTVDSTHWTQDSVTFFSSDPNTIWYQDDQTNQPLAYGPSYTGSIPFLFNKVFLEAFQSLPYPVERGGRINADGASATFPNKSLFFSIKEDLILHSVDMYVLKKEDEGSRRITITKGDGALFAEFTPDLKEGKNKVEIKVTLPKGQYQLNCDRSDQTMNAGDYNYPYPLANLGSIDSCSGNVNFYPYFYNWQFSSPPKICSSERNVYIWLSTPDELVKELIKIYPNPAKDRIKVASENHLITSYVILNIHGKLVAHGELNEKEGIQVSQLVSGMYVLLLKTEEGKNIATKINISRE